MATISRSLRVQEDRDLGVIFRATNEEKPEGIQERRETKNAEQGRVFHNFWWARRDSNPGPRDYESPALTAELRALEPI